jgi:hypothetical protein
MGIDKPGPGEGIVMPKIETVESAEVISAQEKAEQINREIRELAHETLSEEQVRQKITEVYGELLKEVALLKLNREIKKAQKAGNPTEGLKLDLFEPGELTVVEKEEDSEGNLCLLTMEFVNPITFFKNRFEYSSKGERLGKGLCHETTIEWLTSFDDDIDDLSFSKKMVIYKNEEWKKVE